MAALRAAVFSLSAKNRRGGHFLPPPPVRVLTRAPVRVLTRALEGGGGAKNALPEYDSEYEIRNMIRSSVPTKCISRIFDIGDLRLDHFRNLPIKSQWVKIKLPVLSRAPLGCSAERAPLGGGGGICCPTLPNSRTSRRSEEGEAAIESPEREDSNAD